MRGKSKRLELRKEAIGERGKWKAWWKGRYIWIGIASILWFKNNTVPCPLRAPPPRFKKKSLRIEEILIGSPKILMTKEIQDQRRSFQQRAAKQPIFCGLSLCLLFVFVAPCTCHTT